MKQAHKNRIAGTRGRAGFSIVELLIAVSILLISLILTLTIVQGGVTHLSDMRIKSKIRECARLTMEYFGAIPADKAYAMSKSAPKQGNYSSGGGDQDLANFVNDSYPVCKDLSDPGNPLGAKVQLKYTICPGCITYRDTTTTPASLYSTCLYIFKLRLTYNSMYYGGKNMHVDFTTEAYTGQSGDCDTSLNPDGCGIGSSPETKKICTIP